VREELTDSHEPHNTKIEGKGKAATNGGTSGGSDALVLAMKEMQADAPACDVCGTITVRSGTCYKCLNCGNSMGCS
jgi:ribonucleoside-diphosphate reductase alpha chain